MKRLLITAILLGIIYLIGASAMVHIETFIGGNSALALHGIHPQDLKNFVREHYNKNILTKGELDATAEIEILTEHITTDSAIDVIAIVHSDPTCGSGGCIATIFIQNEDKMFDAIPFAYTVKKIEILPDISNDMHDILINDSVRMEWDGTAYAPTVSFEAD